MYAYVPCIMMSYVHNTFILPLVEQTCTDFVNIQQDGNSNIGSNILAIVPRLNFTCDGRITEIMARVRRRIDGSSYPYFQVWRPSPTNSIVYTNIGEVQLQSNQLSQVDSDNYDARIVLTSSDTIEFQSGDVVGYFHPSDILYRVRTLRTSGYIQYEFNETPAPISIDLGDADNDRDQRQPLIQFMIGNQYNYF